MSIKMHFEFTNDQYGNDPEGGVGRMVANLEVDSYDEFISWMHYHLEQCRPPFKKQEIEK